MEAYSRGVGSEGGIEHFLIVGHTPPELMSYYLMLQTKPEGHFSWICDFPLSIECFFFGNFAKYNTVQKEFRVFSHVNCGGLFEGGSLTSVVCLG